VAQKDESLIQEMREQLRGDRERAASRSSAARQTAAPASAGAEPQRSLGARLRALLETGSRRG
jgi:hypothetical protein